MRNATTRAAVVVAAAILVSAVAASPAAAGLLSPKHKAPVHGTGPQGKGTVATLDLLPKSNPMAATNSGEELVLGGATAGEDEEGKNGASARSLELLGLELGSKAGPGESKKGILDPLQESVLDPVCVVTSELVCVVVLKADSKADESSATAETVVLDLEVLGKDGLDVEVAESNARFEEDGDCRKASGDAALAQVGAGGKPALGVAESSSTSDGCPGGGGEGPGGGDPGDGQENSGSIVSLGGVGVGLPLCGAPNSGVSLDPLLELSCNATESIGLGQPGGPAGASEALGATVLRMGNTSLLKLGVGASESRANRTPAP